MAGKVLNIKVCIPLKLHSGLTEKKPEICHYSYNLPLTPIVFLKDGILLNFADFNKRILKSKL